MSGLDVESNNEDEIQFYQQLAGVSDECEFERCVMDVIRKLGYSDFTYGQAMARMGTNGHIICSWSDLLKVYIEAEYYSHDMILHHCLRSEKALFMSTVEQYIASAPFQTEQFSRTLEMIERFRHFGFNDVYYIPVKTQSGSGNAIFAVAARHGSQPEFSQLVNSTKPVLHLLAEAVDCIAASRFSDYFTAIETREETILTPKQLRLLETLAKRNMTLKSAAEQLCISLDTANKHIASAKKALGAKTQASAVYFALKKGLIECDWDINIIEQGTRPKINVDIDTSNG